MVALSRSMLISMKWRLVKESFFALLALLSVCTVAYDYVAHPSAYTSHLILEFDLVVAYLFLADFGLSWYFSRHRHQYFRHNWYILLASIPITATWAELLRGLRLLEFVRLIRAAQHAQVVWQAARRYR